MFDQATLSNAWNSAGNTQPQTAAPPAPAKKSGGGLGGFLSAVTSPARYFLKQDIVNPARDIAATLSGNKVAEANVQKSRQQLNGNNIGEATKRLAGNTAGLATTLLAPEAKAGFGAKVIQGAKVGATAGAGNALANDQNVVKGALEGAAAGGATNGILGKLLEGKTGAASTASKGSFMKNLTTQGQQAQGRVAGISAGTKIAGKELTPQDTAQMLDTLRTEGIKTGNANNTLRDITDKLKSYGQQIADHFKTNDAPLKTEDTKVIADNFIKGIQTTDPGVLKEADILANDLQKNVKSTKDLWEFRKSLDSRIPDAKQAAGDNVLTNKLTAIKNMRQYIANELGDIPGAQNYHALSEIKPFVSAEAKRLNNPGGGFLGRLAASGPVQKMENTLGRATEKIAGGATTAESTVANEPTNAIERVLKSKGIPVKYESDVLTGTAVPESRKVTLTNPTIGNIENELGNLKDKGFSVNQRVGSTPGSQMNFGGENIERQVTPDFTPITPSSKQSSVELTGNKTSIPLTQQGTTEKGIINTPDIYETVQNLPVAPEVKRDILAALTSNPQANRLAVNAATAGAARQANDVLSNGTQPQASNAPETASNSYLSGIFDEQQPSQPTEAQQSPIDKSTLLALIAADPKNASTYVSLYSALKPTAPAAVKPTAQQQGLAQSGIASLKQLAQMIEQDPSVVTKNAVPGQGTPLVGSLVTNTAGAKGYHALADNILSSLIHLQTGATATKEEVTSAHGQLPQPGDSPQEQQQKIRTLLGNFQPFLQGAQ